MNTIKIAGRTLNVEEIKNFMRTNKKAEYTAAIGIARYFGIDLNDEETVSDKEGLAFCGLIWKLDRELVEEHIKSCRDRGLDV